MRCGAFKQGQRHEGFTHVAGFNFPLDQIASHIGRLVDAAGLGSLGDKGIIEQAGTDTVGIDAVDAHILRTEFKRQLA